MDCSSYCVRNLAHFWEKPLLFYLQRCFHHLLSTVHQQKLLCECSARALLFWLLLLMPLSFGDRLALSVRCFLLSLIPEMDQPWPSFLSPCHMWKVPLTIMDIVCLVEYWQNKFIWLSVIQHPLMYLHSLSLYTHAHHGEFFLSLHFPGSLGSLHWVFPEHRYLQTSANLLP